MSSVPHLAPSFMTALFLWQSACVVPGSGADAVSADEMASTLMAARACLARPMRPGRSSRTSLATSSSASIASNNEL